MDKNFMNEEYKLLIKKMKVKDTKENRKLFNKFYSAGYFNGLDDAQDAINGSLGNIRVKEEI